MPNALEEQLAAVSPSSVKETKTPSLSPYERGMFITLTNANCSPYDLQQCLRRLYQSIFYALTDRHESREHIIVSRGRVPNRKRIMDLVVSKTPLVVAGIHKYPDNFNVYHLHLYLYGVHHYLSGSDGASKLGRLKGCLQRYLKGKKKLPKTAVYLEDVGINRNVYRDVVTPTTLYEYLNMPYENPEKTSVINYLAETRRMDGGRFPLNYIYKEI